MRPVEVSLVAVHGSLWSNYLAHFRRVTGFRVVRVGMMSAADRVESGCAGVGVGRSAGRAESASARWGAAGGGCPSGRVPRRTATRWLAAFQTNGLDGLRRVDRADRGGRRLPPEMVELIEGMALRCRLPR